jgi:threonyl-tRNA synthetase
MVKSIYKVFDMSVRAVLSTKPKDAMGDEELWNLAQEHLKSELNFSKLDYSIDAGGGAFYGPKIDFMVKDSEGREFQTATIQLDFQLPRRFDLVYTDEQNKQQIPIVIHRAIFGSFERFIAILLEHYQGKLPLWLAPIQGVILPISEKHSEYCRSLLSRFNSVGYRYIISEDGTLDNRIRLANDKLIPEVLVVGDREVSAKSVNRRSDRKTYEIPEYFVMIGNGMEPKF